MELEDQFYCDIYEDLEDAMYKIKQILPDTPERQFAVAKVQECVFWFETAFEEYKKF